MAGFACCEPTPHDNPYDGPPHHRGGPHPKDHNMNVPADLHPDDQTTRLALRCMLVAAREAAGHSQATLARLMGCTQSAVARFEGSDPQRITRSRLIAHHLGLRIVMYPDGVPGGPYDDPAMVAFRPSDPAAAWVWDQRQVMAALAAARRACGLTQAQLAARLGMREHALQSFERSHDERLFGSLQRYCRGLDGWLWVGVESLRPVEAVAV